MLTYWVTFFLESIANSDKVPQIGEKKITSSVQTYKSAFLCCTSLIGPTIRFLLEELIRWKCLLECIPQNIEHSLKQVLHSDRHNRYYLFINITLNSKVALMSIFLVQQLPLYLLVNLRLVGSDFRPLEHVSHFTSIEPLLNFCNLARFNSCKL